MARIMDSDSVDLGSIPNGPTTFNKGICMEQTQSVEKPTKVTIIIDYKDRSKTVELNVVERVFIEPVYNNYDTAYGLGWDAPMRFYKGERIKDINVCIEGVGRDKDNNYLTICTKVKD